jgi:hypothetical protein
VTKFEKAFVASMAVCMVAVTLVLLFGISMMAYEGFSDAPVQSKCVEDTKARIYEWDGTTQMMYDENC